MKNNLLKLSMVVLIIFLIILSVCISRKKDTFEQKAIVESSDLSQFDTPYTKCIQNADGTYKFYIYAAPVRFKQNGTYMEKDLSLVKADRKEYIYKNKASDIVTYYPAKLTDSFCIQDDKEETFFQFTEHVEGYNEGIKTTYENIYGDEVEAVEYSNEAGDRIDCYSTISGIQVEYSYAEQKELPIIELTTGATSMIRNRNGYVVLQDSKTKQNTVVVYEPIMLESDRLSYGANMYCFQRGYGYQLKTKLPEESAQQNVRLAFSIERYVNKLPDSSVYSGKDTNSYLRSYAVIGKSEEFGTGIHYLRFRLNYYFNMDSDNILQAQYVTRALEAGDSAEITLHVCKEQWSSTQMLWEDKALYDDNICAKSSRNENNQLVFDVTEFTKKCIEDETWSKESVGCAMQCNNGYSVVAASDHSLYVPYLQIILKELPKGFCRTVEINPPSE